MPHIREDINPSPTSVTMPYLRRFVILTTRHGARAYDLYDTMNRIAYFRDQGTYRFDTSAWNIDILSQARGGDINLMDTVMFEMTFEQPTDPVERMSAPIWFDMHGVRVDMAIYDQQEWDIGAAEAVDVVEHAHALWNLWDDGVASQDETDDDDVSGLFSDEVSIDNEIADLVSRMLDEENTD